MRNPKLHPTEKIGSYQKIPTAVDNSRPSIHSRPSKISSIRQNTAKSSFMSTSHRFAELAEVTDLDLRRLILSSPPKSSEPDPLPSFLTQESIDILLPSPTPLCNTCNSVGMLHL